MDLNNHVGKQLLALDIGGGSSPTVQGIVATGVDVDQVVARIKERLNDVLKEELSDIDFILDDDFKVEKHSRTGVILPPEEQRRIWRESLKQIQGVCSEGKRCLNEEIDSHPDNGNEGWWFIDGIRHSAHARASTAREAINKAIAHGAVGDWEICSMPEYMGSDTPEVF